MGWKYNVCLLTYYMNGKSVLWVCMSKRETLVCIGVCHAIVHLCLNSSSVNSLPLPTFQPAYTHRSWPLRHMFHFISIKVPEFPLWLSQLPPVQSSSLGRASCPWRWVIGRCPCRWVIGRCRAPCFISAAWSQKGRGGGRHGNRARSVGWLGPHLCL